MCLQKQLFNQNKFSAYGKPIPRFMKTNFTQFAAIYCLLFLWLTLGCTVRLVSMYDEATDKSLTDIQKKTDDFIQKLHTVQGTPTASFDSTQAFYQAIEKDVKTLLFRVEAIPKNEKTVSLVRNIQLQLTGNKSSPDGASLRELHQLPGNRNNGIPAASLEIAQRNINQTIQAALSLELAKKTRKN
jgi:hypothetical protein